MSDAPNRAQEALFPVELGAGKTCFSCAFGRSKNQTFWDGGHKAV